MEFIDELREFCKERKEQKLRGLNNYNIMTVLRKEDAEVGMHSNFIISLLGIDGEHGQGNLFLKLFIQHVIEPQLKIKGSNYDGFGNIFDVQAEESTVENRRIDFTIKSDKYFIGIEMKIKAKDQAKQISDYYNDLKEKAKNVGIPNSNVIIYYLTLNGNEASEESYQNYLEYKKISFEKEIPKWLIECQKQVSNITNLNNAIGYYIDVVKMITRKYESPLQEYKDFFLVNQSRFEVLFYMREEDNQIIFDDNDLEDEKSLIKNGFNEAKEDLYNNFFEKLLSPILDDNLRYKKYNENLTKTGKKNSDGSILFLTLYEIYDIRLYFKKNKFATISIGMNDDLDLNDTKKNNINTKLNELKTIDTEKNEITYITGKTKGKSLVADYTIPEPSIDNLFKVFSNNKTIHNNTQDNRQEHIDKNLQNNIQEHIESIKKVLKD